ncbi:hypothetical protein [Pedobacter africanus]|uniref:Uncharacterized protein n=1 Tax=Pedobacter africanus TaxID=151894 RepID=A0A1W2AVI9_9SPHI|nr:hypothetical protein [Pedobacter africanus]SMC64705.1 hypothetical protein SAMN04488524_1695 [Pedobacter africanus]
MTYKILIAVVFLVYCNGIKAQHMQQAVVPKWLSNVKIDGKLDEWAELKYEKQNNLWFALANSDKYLYLAIKRDKNLSKVDRGGINFTLSTDKKDKISFTYPVLLSSKPDFDVIRPQGISIIPDSIISVYNEHGIKAALVKETGVNGLVYNIEFAIPLKLIRENLPDYDNQVLHYAIILNGSSNTKAAALLMSSSIEAPTPELREKVIDLYTRTEFKGTYNMVRKPE